MKILVCISQVPDTTSKINFSENNTVFDKTGVQFVINPNDEFGLTRAVWFKEKNNAVVHVINVGLSETESTLRKALAIGADKAIRINHNPKDGHSSIRKRELPSKCFPWVLTQLMGLVESRKDFLLGLRKLCDENKTLLIFDEVMSGFRLSKGGAQEIYNVIPRLSISQFTRNYKSCFIS